MISPVSMTNVSKVHFGDAANALSREGAYAKQAAQETNSQESSDEKKSSTGKKVAIGAAVVAVALATLAILSRKNVLIKALDANALNDAHWYSPKKWGHYLNKAGNKIAEWTWDPVVKLWNKVFSRSASGSGAPEPPTPPTGAGA